jgi:hypothetical protein
VNDVIRLRGDATPLVWPPTIKPIIRQLADLCEHGAPQERRSLSEWQRAVDQARDRANSIFADAQGWRVRDEFDYSRLLRRRGDSWIPDWAAMDVFDHPTFYGVPGRDVAMVVQPYRALSHDEIPEGITVDLPPESWWWPFSVRDWPQGLSTSAYVLRPAPRTTK